MSFPKKVYGRCEESGHLGPDYSSVSHSNAEVVYGASGSGYPLVEYQGKLICKPCKRRLQSDAESLEGAKKDEKEQSFRASAGFQRL